MEQEESAYITSVHLKGYKSIRDVSVTLNKGLNILIGANGSGKTNFLEFLDAACKSDFELLLNERKVEFEIQGNEKSVKALGEKVFRKNLINASYRVEIGNLKNSEIVTYLLDENKKAISRQPIHEWGIGSFQIFNRVLILKFENTLKLIFKDKLTLQIDHSEEAPDIYLLVSNLSNKPQTFLNDIFYYYDSVAYKNLIDSLNEITLNNFFSIENLQQNLYKFSPIKNIVIDWELTRRNIVKNEYGETALIEGIDFQFYVNNEWINWTQLSDGTKRLFYLIGSVTYATENEIILIEEPELGVHPHQLALLMNFLKSESEDKQIIISTHSPQVLNCLGEDELDRIIVARHEGKAGTKLYHLSDEEKGYASEYMINEAFLSDYWMLSGFMNEEPTENA